MTSTRAAPAPGRAFLPGLLAATLLSLTQLASLAAAQTPPADEAPLSRPAAPEPLEGAVVRTEHVEATLLSEWASIPAEGGQFFLALRQNIIPGWHTYWRNPGDSGEPTQIQWEETSSAQIGPLEWPHPHRLPYGPLVNFGYEGEVLFPIKVTVAPGQTPGRELTLEAHVYWLVCEEICIPQDGILRLSLPVEASDARPDPEAAEIIAKARRSLPRPSPWSARFEADSAMLTLGIEAPDLAGTFGPGLLQSAAFFPHEPGLIDNTAEPVLRSGPGGFTLAIPAGPELRNDGDLERLTGVLVLEDRSSGASVSNAVIVDAAPTAIPADWRTSAVSVGESGFADLGVLQILGFALLGGLLLNVMPCVFPVLFMKAFGFMAAAREAPWVVRGHGLLFTAGVVISFLVLAGLLIGLRAAGEQIGWGFQLQSPVLVAALLYLLLVVGLNLSGVFEVGQSLMGLGGGVGAQSGPGAAFLTGVLATVVATPCTAPFMGAAVGAALTLPTITALTIFAALGLGMALPWLILSFLPGLLKLLPRPGPWMETARQALAFPMYATAAWLLWVLSQQVGPQGLALILGGLVLVALAAWLFGHSQGRAVRDGLGVGGWLARAVAVVALVGAGAFAWSAGADRAGGPVETAGAPVQAGAISWQTYDPATLDTLLAEGRPVFLNFTAAWCVTCLVNERTVLSRASVVEGLEAGGVVPLKADWTNRSAQILNALEGYGRSGVPLYVFFPASSGDETADPMILPQLLSETQLLELFETTARNPTE